jgi:hypothetical protein
MSTGNDGQKKVVSFQRQGKVLVQISPSLGETLRKMVEVSIWQKTKTLLFGECRLGKTAPCLVLDTGTTHRPNLSKPSLAHFT